AGNGEERTDFAVGRLDEFHAGAARLEHPVFYIVDLGQLPDVEGVPLDGLVGYELFTRFGTTIDYARREFVLTAADRFAPPAGAAAIPFDMDDRVPIVQATLGGLPARITIDTGSRSSLTLHSPFVRANDLVARYHAAAESVIGWGIGGAVRGRVARLPTLVIGDQHVDGIAGDLFTGDKGSYANPDLSGNLGSGVLRRFTVAFDYAGKKMYLAPNAEFGKPDAFDRSGLWLLRDGDKLQVTDVVAGTAADRAGLRVSDRIVAFDDEPVGTRSLAAWRVRLRESAAGTSLRVRFERSAETKSTTLTLAERLPAVAAK
ncbi:MAG TPA: PDZ domain-containing protein, partial [Caldimonas sp.]|nr:PDZ domain-containing protein [Caldimonas sp.]